jgi:hypothetical protein
MTDDYGTAVCFSNTNGGPTFSNTTFLACENLDTAADGTIMDEDGSISSYDGLNFTECRLAPGRDDGDGVVIRDRGSAGSLEFRYCTVVECTGSSGLRVDLKSLAIISQCNFYDNAIGYQTAANRALFYADYSGMDIRECIFSGYSTGVSWCMAVEGSRGRVSHSQIAFSRVH